jgi:hypothetical protein
MCGCRSGRQAFLSSSRCEGECWAEHYSLLAERGKRCRYPLSRTLCGQQTWGTRFLLELLVSFSSTCSPEHSYLRQTDIVFFIITRDIVVLQAHAPSSKETHMLILFYSFITFGPSLWSNGQSSWLTEQRCSMFPVRYDLNLYMLCRRK